MAHWFTETSVSRPTGDWRWRIGMFSSRPILQILVRRECRPPGATWIPAPLTKLLPPIKPRLTLHQAHPRRSADETVPTATMQDK